MHHHGSHVPYPVNSIQQSPNQISTGTITTIGLSVIFVPICIAIGLILHKRYRAYRVAILYQQIEMLERLWRMSPKK